MPIVEVPFAYEIEAVRPKKRAAEKITVWDRTPVSFDAIADAPVAVRAVRSRDEATVEFKYHDGRLWQPVRSLANPAEDVNGYASQVAETNPFIDPKSPLRKANNGVENNSNVAVRQLIASGREAAVAAAQARANDLLLIGGVLYEASPGPVLWLKPQDARKQRATLICGDLDDEEILHASIHRADEWDVAIAFGEAEFKYSPSTTTGRPEVLMPEALSFDSARYALVESARYVFGKATEEASIGSLPSPYLEAYLAYTDPAFDREEPSAELVKLVQTAGEALKGVRNTGNGHQAALMAVVRSERDLTLDAEVQSAIA